MALALFAGPGMVWAGDSDKHRLINQQRVQDLKERVADDYYDPVRGIIRKIMGLERGKQIKKSSK